MRTLSLGQSHSNVEKSLFQAYLSSYHANNLVSPVLVMLIFKPFRDNLWLNWNRGGFRLEPGASGPFLTLCGGQGRALNPKGA